MNAILNYVMSKAEYILHNNRMVSAKRLCHAAKKQCLIAKKQCLIAILLQVLKQHVMHAQYNVFCNVIIALQYIFAETTGIKKCDLRCRRLNIPPSCVGKDYIILDDKLCQTCDLNVCLLTEWPPKVAIQYCPMLKCSKLKVPLKCVIRQFRTINRKTLCRACDVDVCKNPPMQTATTSSPVNITIHPLCPKLRCKLSGIPKECLQPSYEIINGQRCRQCDEDACRHPPALRISTKRTASY